MLTYVKRMVDNEGKSDIFIFEGSNPCPIRVLSDQDAEILRQSLEALDNEGISLHVPAPIEEPGYKHEVKFKKYR